MQSVLLVNVMERRRQAGRYSPDGTVTWIAPGRTAAEAGPVTALPPEFCEELLFRQFVSGEEVELARVGLPGRACGLRWLLLDAKKISAHTGVLRGA